MRLLGHPGSDLDETWWKLFPGVSRSFLNSSGTKITGKNTKNMKFKISKNRKIWNFKNSKSRHAEVSQGRISTRRIRICGRKLKNQTVRAEKLKFKISKKHIFGFLVIAHKGSHGFGPDLVGIFPRSLPQLSKQLRDQNNRQKPRKKRKIEI